MAELSAGEKRFLKEWSYQKSGSRTGYFVMYTIAWTLIIYILSMVGGYFFNIIRIPGIEYVIRFICVFLAGFLVTVSIFFRNQSEYYRIRLKELDALKENGSGAQE
jgi:hypothetical protein